MSEESLSVLSEREMEILRLVAQGLSNKEIARELYISANTVKVHLRNIFGKLQVSSRTEATMLAVRQGWVIVDTETPEGETVPASEAVEPLALWQQLFLLLALAVMVFMLAWTWPLSMPSEKAPENPLVDSVEAVALVEPPSLPTRWQEEVPISIARGRLAVVAVNGMIYAIGGETSGGITGAVEAYDPTRQAWVLKATKPVPVANVGGAVLNGKVYVPGGLTFSGRVTNVLEVYDPVADRWEQAEPLPAPRAAYALAVHASRLYLFGGNDGQQDVSTLLVYDPAAGRWQALPGKLPPQAFAAAATVDDKIYIVGGYAAGRELDTCRVYLPVTGEWGSCAPMLENRGGLGLVAVGRQLRAIGGGWEEYLAYNQWYDPDKDTWFRFETPISGQWRNAGVAELDGRVHVIGGWSEEYLNVNLTYQAIWKAFIPSLSR